MKDDKEKYESYDTVAIKSISDYIEKIESYNHQGISLFRGQKEDWNLLPKLARKKITIGSTNRTPKLDQKEKELIEEFRKRSSPYLPEKFSNDIWELLSIAQHHGLSTRLLDWSTNPLAALWFTVRNGIGSKSREYGTVWFYRAEKEDVVTNETKSPFNSDRTMVYIPSHVTLRITAQNSVFTVHKYISLHDWFYKFESNRREKVKLLKIKIYKDLYTDFEKQLDTYGFNEASMFPGLDGIAKHIEWKSNLT